MAFAIFILLRLTFLRMIHIRYALDDWYFARDFVDASAIYWVEYQALVDIMNVYKVDPVVAIGLPATGKPIVRIIRIRLMLEETTYQRFRLNFLRIHRQPVMGNARRYFYDYYMECSGSIALADRVDDPDGAVAPFAADARLIEDAADKAAWFRSPS
jgi:hypothetical protein